MAHRKTNTTRATAIKYTWKKRMADQHLLTGDSSGDALQGEITLSQPPKKRGRGPGVVADSVLSIEERPVIWPVGDHEFSCDQDPRQIVKSVTRLALTYMPRPLRSYHMFDLDTKNAVERAFLERFTYRENEDPNRCREVLDAIASKRYSEKMNTARDKCFQEFGRDTEKWKGMVPHWCLHNKYWLQLCDIFASEEWQGLSQKNRSNRTSSGLSVAHYGGSASIHQHKNKLSKLMNGTEPTPEQLYLHTHCRLEDGKSPVMAQIESSIQVDSQQTDNSESNAVVNPSTEGATIQDNPFDVNNLHFTNRRAREVYEDVTEKKADAANAGKDETTLFIDAVGGLNRGRLRGFGCVLDNHVPPSMRSKQTHPVSSISGLTTLGERTFTESQWRALLEERDRRQDEEREERKREQANNNQLFSQLFSMLARTQTNLPAQAPISDKPDEVVGGNMLSFQDLAAAIRGVNQVGPYQSLLSVAQNGQEAASDEAAMNQWFGPSN